MPTGYLDLTDNFNVGAFFATCREHEGRWEPVDEGVGVVYRVELARGFSTPFGQYLPLGPQPLPRPTDQRAWVTELPITHAFDGWPGVMIMLFQQERSVGEHFLERFDGGSRLFPHDPLAEIAGEILNCEEIPDVLIDGAISSFAEDEHGIRPDQAEDVKRAILKMVSVGAYRRLLSEQMVESLREDFEWRKKMLGDIKVRWRAIRSEPRLTIASGDDDDSARPQENQGGRESPKTGPDETKP